jgi:hypothetical protein
MSISKAQFNADLESSDTGPPPGVNLEDVINSFLMVNSEPTDEQVHAFARTVGVDYKVLEAKVYEMLGDIMTKQNPTDTVDLENLGPQDPLDTFILTFFLFNASPTDDQVHDLAELVNVSHEELEERIYRMLAEHNQESDDNSVEVSALDDFGSDFPGEADTGADKVDTAVSVNRITTGKEGSPVGVGSESQNWEGSPETTPLATLTK